MAVLDGLGAEVEKRWDADATLFDQTVKPKRRTVFVTEVNIAEELDSSGEDAVFVILSLTDPEEGQEGWPIDEIAELRTIVQEAVDKIQPDFDRSWYVRFVAQGQMSDDGEAVDLDET